MKKLILYLVVLCTSGIWAQAGFVKKEVDKNHGWEDGQSDENEIFYAGLIKVEESPYKFHIRYIDIFQIADIYSNDGITFSGEIISHLFERTPKKLKSYNYQKNSIDSATASKIGSWIVTEKLYLIPTDSLINGYEWTWNDAPEIDFKYKINDSISSAHYTFPEHQFSTDEQPELQAFCNYYQTIDSLLPLKKHWKDFITHLKKGACYNNGSMSDIYIPTKKETRDREKAISELPCLVPYKDTINNYLRALVARADYKDMTGCNDYRLLFSKSGKLKNIRDNSTFFSRIANRELRQHRKKIRSIFKNSDLCGLQLKYGFERGFGFCGTTGHLSDNNEYYLLDL